MAVVKNLAFFNKNKLKKLNSFRESELDMSVFHHFPLDFFHHFLPFKLKFLNETFVTSENGEIQGLTTVAKAGVTRAKITRLLLDEPSLEAGKFLVNCVMTTFLSKGAESFYVVIDKMNTPLITMFKEGCGFKSFGKEIVYKTENKNALSEVSEFNFEHIRKMEFADIKGVEELINSMMNSYQKATFKKDSSELRRNFFTPIKQFVIYDKIKRKILGYFSITDLNKKDRLLDFVVESGFEGYVFDIIKFAKLNTKKSGKNLLLKLKSYYTNFNPLEEMFKMEFDDYIEHEILVKDFLVAKTHSYSFEKMIFNDVTPAF